jgi:hypothetical protein
MKRLILSAIIMIFHSSGWGQVANPPPIKPIVQVVAGDKEVVLYWDDRAEEVPDFEGYIIHRSTEPTFREVQTITDGFGDPTYYEPIAQFDRDNGFAGPHPVAVRGIKFNVGEDTGLVHTWTDSGQVSAFPIENGRLYYYAVCSYDRGDTTLSLPPSISNLDSLFNFIYDDSNTVAVTPRAPAAGYVPPKIESDQRSSSALVYLEYVHLDTEEPLADDLGYPLHEYRTCEGDFLHPLAGPGTGAISVHLLDPSKVKDYHTYQIAFHDTGYFHQTVSYSVYDITSGDTLVANSRCIYSRDIQKATMSANRIAERIGSVMQYREFGPFFDGMTINVFNHPTVSYIDSLSGWVVGDCNYQSHVELVGNQIIRIVYPADYEIQFYDHVVDTSTNGIATQFEVWNVTDSLKSDFRFTDNDNDSQLTPGDNIYPIIYQDSSEKRAWNISFVKPIDKLRDTNYLELDGSDDYATGADTSFLDVGDDSTEDLTIEAWIYLKRFGGTVASDDGYALGIVPRQGGEPQGIQFAVKGAGLYHSITMRNANLFANEWHHVVGIFDNEANRLAVGFDGDIFWSDQDTTTFNLDNTDSLLYVGSYYAITDFFEGAIDQLHVSDTVRYPASSSHYTPDSTFIPDEHSRALWYFDEAAESVSFSDTSGNGNALTGRNGARTGPPTPIPPEPGDIFRVRCAKPFRGSWTDPQGETLVGDVFQFETRAAHSEETIAKSQLDDIAVVPNPYTVQADWEQTDPASGQRERRIYFINLPPRATIRIYTLSGYLVDRIDHDNPADDGSEPWDLRSKDDQDIAYGVYIYHVHAPGVGEKIGKFAVIK